MINFYIEELLKQRGYTLVSIIETRMISQLVLVTDSKSEKFYAEIFNYGCHHKLFANRMLHSQFEKCLTLLWKSQVFRQNYHDKIKTSNVVILIRTKKNECNIKSSTKTNDKNAHIKFKRSSFFNA